MAKPTKFIRVDKHMVKEGGEEAKEAVIKTLQAEYEELRDIAVLRAYDEWVLHLTFKDGAVPYYVAGDGIRYALMYLMEGLRVVSGLVPGSWYLPCYSGWPTGPCNVTLVR